MPIQVPRELLVIKIDMMNIDGTNLRSMEISGPLLISGTLDEYLGLIRRSIVRLSHRIQQLEYSKARQQTLFT